MLRLVVNNKDVALNADTNFELVKENPFFSKEGNYTYDIEVSLRAGINASIFAGIKNFNNRNLDYNLHGEILDDDELICKGKVIILSKEDRTVHLQLVSDNSELNYIFNRKKIRNLDLGEADTNMVDILENADKHYPDVNYSFPMVRGYGASDDYNVYANVSLGNFSYAQARTNMVAQPYLLFVVREIFDAIGFRLERMFVEEEEKWKRLLMINPYKTNELAKMLPDWTATEFISEVERFFNGVFLLDDEIVTFESVSSWYASQEEEVLIDQNVIDAFDINFLEEDNREALGYDYSNVAYMGHNDLYWKAAKISNNFLEKCRIIEDAIDMNNFKSFEVYSDIRTGLLSKPYAETQIVEDEDGKQVEEIVNGAINLRQINHFRDYVTNEDDEQILLKIFPCEIINSAPGGIFVPVVYVKNIATQNEKFWEALTEEKEDDKIDYMNVAFYLGKQYAMAGWDTVYPTLRLAPQCSVTYHQFFGDKDVPFIRYAPNIIVSYDEYMTLELAGSKGRGQNELDNHVDWDNRQLYTVRFLTKENLDPKKIFRIKGDRFVCKQLKYSFTNCKKNIICEGQFYRLNGL